MAQSTRFRILPLHLPVRAPVPYPTDLADRAGAGELAEPGIAVGMHPAAEARQMRLRMFGPPVH